MSRYRTQPLPSSSGSHFARCFASPFYFITPYQSYTARRRQNADLRSFPKEQCQLLSPIFEEIIVPWRPVPSSPDPGPRSHVGICFIPLPSIRDGWQISGFLPTLSVSFAMSALSASLRKFSSIRNISRVGSAHQDAAYFGLARFLTFVTDWMVSPLQYSQPLGAGSAARNSGIFHLSNRSTLPAVVSSRGARSVPCGQPIPRLCLLVLECLNALLQMVFA